MKPIRSLLICTTTIERHLKSALASDADAVMLDLETTIVSAEKELARGIALQTLELAPRPAIFARINEVDSADAFDDLMALKHPALRGVVVPKAEDPRQVMIVDWMLSRMEEKYDRAGAQVEILPLIESARGVENIAAITAASKRIRQVTFGQADYCLDTGIRNSRDEDEIAYIRSRLLHASRAQKLEAPIDTVWLDLNDAEGLDNSLARGKQAGFFGKLCIHPSQAKLANAAFTPSAEEVAEARKIAEGFEEAMGKNIAAIRIDGRLIDLPIARKAQRIVDLWKSFGSTAS
jgi:citrate lyase subunit beta / citryl-CoA lyase